MARSGPSSDRPTSLRRNSNGSRSRQLGCPALRTPGDRNVRSNVRNLTVGTRSMPEADRFDSSLRSVVAGGSATASGPASQPSGNRCTTKPLPLPARSSMRSGVTRGEVSNAAICPRARRSRSVTKAIPRSSTSRRLSRSGPDRGWSAIEGHVIHVSRVRVPPVRGTSRRGGTDGGAARHGNTDRATGVTRRRRCPHPDRAACRLRPAARPRAQRRREAS